MAGRVFILGAGFSYALGGPLFSEILTSRFDLPVHDMIGERWANSSKKSLIVSAGNKIQGLKASFPELDLDMERLLEKLDSIGQSNDSLRLAENIRTHFRDSDPGLASVDAIEATKTIVTNLKKRLAMETMLFAATLDRGSERWDPFDVWYSNLDSNDTIISFNYDPVIELLALRNGTPYGTDSVNGLLEHSSNPVLLKLHGSCNWLVDNGVSELGGIRTLSQSGSSSLEDCFANTTSILESHDVIIGIPGLHKKNLKTSILSPLWNRAIEAIQMARHVSIVGYSMPATDNLARMTILNAIANGERHKRMISLVLGPSSGTIIAKRMKAIIEPIVRCNIIDHPMYAQEFLENADRIQEYALK